VAHRMLNLATLRKVGILLRDHRPAQIFNILRFGYHAFRGFPTPQLLFDPLWMDFFITARCNLRCLQCVYRSPDSPQEPQLFKNMSMDDFIRVLNRYPRTTSVSLAGGEPLLHPDVFEMSRVAHQRKMKVHIFTNGSLLENLVDQVLAAPIEFFNLSFYGMDSESFSRVTGGSGVMFDSIKKAARSLARKRQPGGYPHILRASFICTKRNLEQLIPFVRLCEEIGFDQVKLRNLLPWGIPGYEDTTCLHEGDPEVALFMEELRRQKFRIPVFLPRLHKAEYRPRRCDMPFRILTIDGDGCISQCCNIATRPCYGNIFKDADAWNGPTMLGARRDLRNAEKDLPACCMHCEEMVPDRIYVGG